MNRYDSYKDSGQYWIGEIPSIWGVSRVKRYFNERNEKVSDLDFQPLSVTKNGILPQLKNVAKSDNHNDRKRVCKNDFVINSRSDRKGSSGMSVLDGSVSLINIVLEPKSITPKYSEYIFKSKDFIEEFFRNGKGIHWDLWSTRFSELQNIKIPIPSLFEQQQIVSFLDTKTSLIDSLIEKTQQKIVLIKEKRTSLINEVVTKGLNSNVKMKDSGVEWIGEIPYHYKNGKLKHLCNENQSSLSNSTDPDYGLNYIEISDVNSEGVIGNSTPYIFSESPSRCRRIVQKGDVIVSTVRTYLKSIGLIEEEVEDLICSTGFSVLTPNIEINSKYLFYLLRTEWFISMVISKSEGVSYPSIQSEKLMNIDVVFCELSEQQQQIVEYLDEQTQLIDNTISIEEKRIELLKEYRQSLISEVVTGKLKVTTDE